MTEPVWKLLEIDPTDYPELGWFSDTTMQQLVKNQPYPEGWEATAKEFIRRVPHWTCDLAANLALGLRANRLCFARNPSLPRTTEDNLFGGRNNTWVVDKLERQRFKILNLLQQAVEEGDLGIVEVEGPVQNTAMFDVHVASESYFQTYVDRDEVINLLKSVQGLELPKVFETNPHSQTRKGKKISATQTQRHLANKNATWLWAFALYSRNPTQFQHEDGQINIGALQASLDSLTKRGLVSESITLNKYRTMSGDFSAAIESLEG